MQILMLMSNISFYKKYDPELVLFLMETNLKTYLHGENQSQKEFMSSLVHLYTSMTERLILKKLETTTKAKS